MKNINKLIILASVIFITAFTSCIKYDFDAPKEAGFDLNFEPNISIKDLITEFAGAEPTLIDSALIIKGTVIGNDKSGNLYKSFIIQDSTETGIQTGLLVSINEYESHNKYHIGDMIYIKCEGLYLGEYGGVIQLGSYDKVGLKMARIEEPIIDLHIFNASGGKKITPKVVALSQIGAVNNNTLIKLEDVQFAISELGETFANSSDHTSSDQILVGCNGGATTIRTSGYSKFASDTLPSKKGSIVLIKSEFNGNTQLTINDINDVNFTEERCGAFYEKSFDEITFSDPGGSTINGFTNGNWFSYSVTGTMSWFLDYHGYNGTDCATMKNYNSETSSNETSETWLISPAFNLTLLENPILNFKTAKNYSGPVLEMKVSVDYSGSGDPSVATWENINAVLSSGSFTWTDSGDLNMSSYKTSDSVYIAFVYSGTESSGSTWEVDDIQFSDNQ